MKFKVTICRHWKEYGEVIVEAEDKLDAREVARDIITSGDDGVEWEEMTPESDDVEDVMEVEET